MTAGPASLVARESTGETSVAPPEMSLPEVSFQLPSTQGNFRQCS